MENCDSCPKEGVKVLPVTKTSVGVTEHATKQLHAEDAKNKVKLVKILNLAALISNLKINIKRERRPKNTTTLSIVRSMTTSCL